MKEGIENPTPFWDKMAKKLRSIYESTPYFKGKWQIFNLLGRFARWKGYRTEISFDLGEKIILDIDDWIPYQIFLTGYYAIEYLHTSYFRKIVKEGMVFFDVGANIGYYTLQAAVRVGKGGKVYAFEPVSSTYKKLKENVEINSLTNVVLCPFVIYEKEGEMEIALGDKGNSGSAKIPFPDNSCDERKEKVRAITLDNFVERNRINRVDLVKIDVEGCEYSVLKGMVKILSKLKPTILIELTENTLKARGTSSFEVINFLKGYGYCPYKIIRNGVKRIRRDFITGESLILFKQGDAKGV
ncbi:MAG: FkbM family methyltransferase [Candidatus Schekmanbacteria bacterium]|nr:MAG: FkbM family methyltransferase [Candidatus Schekmanbacteria bacterium]